MLDGLSEKQIRERIRFLSDKMEALWEKISPDLDEFDNLKVEFGELYVELNKRGLLDVKTHARDGNGENAR